jgi:hypothetical protein
MRWVALSILGFSLAKICDRRILGADGVTMVVWTACYLAPACASKRMTIRDGATEQIVGRERRERVSQIDSPGDASMNSRRRVNSNVRR